MRAAATFLAILGLASRARAADQVANATTEATPGWVGGWCGVHVQVAINVGGQQQIARVRIYDGEEKLINRGQWSAFKAARNNRPMHGEVDGLESPLKVHASIDDNLVIPSPFPPLSFLLVLADANSFTLPPPSPQAVFEYKSDRWESGIAGSNNDRCSVGRWNIIRTKDRYSEDTVDMDCGFPC